MKYTTMRVFPKYNFALFLQHIFSQIMKKYGVLFLLLGVFQTARAYTPKADSLLKTGMAARSGELRLEALLLFCEEYRTFSYDSLKKYASLCMELSEKLHNDAGLAKSYYYLSLYYYKISNSDSSTHYLNLLDKPAHNTAEAGTLALEADCLSAGLLVKSGKHKAASSYYFKILSRSQQNKDTVGIIRSLNGLGWTRLEMEQYEEAKKWFLKAIGFSHSGRYDKDIIVVYSNLAPCYGALGNLDSARYAVEKSIDLSQQYNDLASQANSLNNLSNIYIELEDYNKAAQFIEQSVEIRQKIGDPYYIVSDLAQLSMLYSRIKRYKDGISLAEKGLKIAKENKLEPKLSLLYSSLFQNYYAQKDYKSSTEALLVMMDLKDTLYKRASAIGLAEMEVKYETAQKENTIQQQQFQLARKNYWIFGSVSVLGLGLLSGVIAYRNYHHKQQVKIQKMQLQQQTVLTESILQAEETERRRFAADLHDGLGQILTAARYNLAGIADDMQWDEEDKAVLHKAIALIDEGCKEVRTVSHNILPNSLLKSGLGNAVKDFIESINQKRLSVNFSATGLEEKLQTQTEVIIYRIIQECVNNVIKHADADKLDISLILDASGFSMSIEDNGNGFNLYQVNATKGMGLKSIKTRAAYLKGNLEIDTRPGKGTLVSLHIPSHEIYPA